MMDLACTNPNDTTEDGTTQCDDGLDNDGDAFVDYPNDPGCSDPADDLECDNCAPYQQGCILTSWWEDHYQQPQTTTTLTRMQSNGCRWVSILVTWYQGTLSSTTINP
ncbi:MAG: hypothetical protein IIC02_13070, partial [Planctomycetes bacterium]|nr:hypothetical protein [Planctomycetota bacterium]